MRNSMMMLSFSVFWLEIPFYANLFQKIKIVSLSWNFALDQFEYAEICRKYVVFTFSVLKSGQRNKNCQFNLKFGTMTNLNKRNSMMIFAFSVLDNRYLS